MAGLRERKKERVRLAIQREAIRLFLDQGFDQTTVEQIAEAADVSPATIYRYFTSKEDLVVTDEYDPIIIQALLERPADEPLIESVRAMMLGVMAEYFERDRELLAALNEAHVEVVCLAGFMRVLGPYFLRAFPHRILNIHPALLPSFPGLDAQKQALDYGVKFTGCTVHLVDEGVDTGPILCQAVVPVLDDDTVESLSARILKEEHRIYSEAIRLVVEDRIRIEGRRVFLKK